MNQLGSGGREVRGLLGRGRGSFGITGTLIEAIIFDGDSRTAALPQGLPCVPLGADLTMLPVTSDVLATVDPDAVGDERIPSGWMLRQPVATLARALLADRRVLYLFSETAGGPGTADMAARPLRGRLRRARARPAM